MNLLFSCSLIFGEERNCDGLLDLLVIDLSGRFRYFERVHDGMLLETDFDFSNVTEGLDSWRFSTPVDAKTLYVGRRLRLQVADWDRDGDADLIVVAAGICATLNQCLTSPRRRQVSFRDAQRARMVR